MGSSDNAIPPGWSYNPATLGQRLPIVVLAILGLSLVKGKTEGTYGGGWAAIWGKVTLHAREARKQPRV